MSEQIILEQVPSSFSRNSYHLHQFGGYTLGYSPHYHHGNLALSPALQSCQVLKAICQSKWKQKYYLLDRALQNIWVLFFQLKMFFPSSHTPINGLTKHQFPANKSLLLRSAKLDANCKEKQHMLLYYEQLLNKSQQKPQVQLQLQKV